MEVCEQESKYYFRATNSVDRIMIGDVVLVDTNSEITLCSIVLAAPDLQLQKAEHVHVEQHIGKVVSVYISH